MSRLDYAGAPDAADTFVDRAAIAAPVALFQLGSSLVDKHLVQPIGDAAGHPRFRLLETIREFGLERLASSGEEPATGEAHARTFLALAEAAEPYLRGPEQAHWFDRLELEHPNLRAAMDWFQTHDERVSALRLAVALGRFWEARGHLTEGRQRIAALLDRGESTSRSSVPALVRAKAESWAGTIGFWQGDYREAATLHERARQRFEEAGDDCGAALSLLHLGQAVTYQGNLERGRQLITASLDRFRAAGDAWGIAAAQSGLVNPLLEAGDLGSAEQLVADSLPVVRAVADPDMLAMTLNNEGWLASARGADAEAERALAESLALFQEFGDRRTAPYVLNLLGLIAWRRGDRSRAGSFLVEGLTLSRDIGSKLAVLNSFVALTRVAVGDTKFAEGARLLGAAAAIRAAMGTPIQPVEQSDVEALLAAVRATLGESAFTTVWDEGYELSLETAIGFGLAFASDLETAASHGEQTATRAPATTTTTSGLSPRELDVLRLVVEGHSNAEIAATLSISHRTVRNHLTNMFAKLGVATRTAAATSALRSGLIETVVPPHP